MHVIPAINAKTFEEVQEQLRKIEGLSDLIHIDITDGIFSAYPTWNNAEDFKKLQVTNSKATYFEIHLMVKNPEAEVEKWFLPNVRRIIFHIEATGSPGEVIEKCHANRIEVFISHNPETPSAEIFPYIPEIDGVQVLAVIPGAPGQPFDPNILQKIYLLREKFPNVKIEVDGGINPSVAQVVKELMGDAVVSASYILKSSDPKKAYEELASI